MAISTTFHSLPYAQQLRYLPLSEHIRLTVGCDTLGKIRIGKFILPFNGSSIFLIPPLQSCTLNVKNNNDALCYTLPLNCLSKIERQQLLAVMYHRPMLVSNKFITDKVRLRRTCAESETVVVNTLKEIINSTLLEEHFLNPVCDKITSSACRLMNYMATFPSTLDYLNVFTVAQYLQCSVRSLQRLSNTVFGMPAHSIFGYHLAMEGVNRVLYQGESVKEAARETGYSTTGAYYKCFKAQVGVASPKFVDSIVEIL